MVSKNTICLWYDGTALDAAQFYAKTFPDSAVGAVHRTPGDYPAGKQGDVLTVEFRVMGIPCLGLSGAAAFKHNEAFSFQVATDVQAETDRLWSAIVGNGGQESACGWCRDKWGLSWQITPRTGTRQHIASRVRKRVALVQSLALNYSSEIDPLGACWTAPSRDGRKCTARSEFFPRPPTPKEPHVCSTY